MNNAQLEGAFSDSDVGEADMFGLDTFGVPQGLNAMWGAAIGGGVGTVAAIMTRTLSRPHSTAHRYSEGVGFLAAGLASGALMFSPKTRHAGWASLVTALVNNGLRQVEHSLFPPKFHHHEIAAMHQKAISTDGTATAKDAEGASTAALPPAPPTPAPAPGGWNGYNGYGLGIHAIEPGYPVPAGYVPAGTSGLGAPIIEPAYPIPGSVHADGGGEAPVGPPTLLDAGDYGLQQNPAVKQNALLGGPQLSALGAHFGSTLFSNN